MEEFRTKVIDLVEGPIAWARLPVYRKIAGEKDLRPGGDGWRAAWGSVPDVEAFDGTIDGLGKLVKVCADYLKPGDETVKKVLGHWLFNEWDRWGIDGNERGIGNNLVSKMTVLRDQLREGTDDKDGLTDLREWKIGSSSGNELVMGEAPLTDALQKFTEEYAGASILPVIRRVRSEQLGRLLCDQKIIDVVSQESGFDRDLVVAAYVELLRVGAFCTRVVADGGSEVDKTGVRKKVYDYVWEKWQPPVNLGIVEMANNLVAEIKDHINGSGNMVLEKIAEVKKGRRVWALGELLKKKELDGETIPAKRIEMLTKKERLVLAVIKDKTRMTREKAIIAALSQLPGMSEGQIGRYLETINQILNGSKDRFVGTDGIPMVDEKQPIGLLRVLLKMEKPEWKRLSGWRREVMEYLKERDEAGHCHTLKEILKNFHNNYGEELTIDSLSSLMCKIKADIKDRGDKC